MTTPPAHLVTSQAVPGREAHESLGIVTAQSDLSDLHFGYGKSYELPLLHAHERCLDQLAERARGLGADAVVSVHLDAKQFKTDSPTGMILVLATGTAVKLR